MADSEFRNNVKASAATGSSLRSLASGSQSIAASYLQVWVEPSLPRCGRVPPQLGIYKGILPLPPTSHRGETDLRAPVQGCDKFILGVHKVTRFVL